MEGMRNVVQKFRLWRCVVRFIRTEFFQHKIVVQEALGTFCFIDLSVSLSFV